MSINKPMLETILKCSSINVSINDYLEQFSLQNTFSESSSIRIQNNYIIISIFYFNLLPFPLLYHKRKNNTTIIFVSFSNVSKCSY